MISVSDQTYEKLAKIKGGKSFSRLLDDLTESRNERILQFAGILKDSWRGGDSAKWVESMRKEGEIGYEKRWKRLEKHWKG